MHYLVTPIYLQKKNSALGNAGQLSRKQKPRPCHSYLSAKFEIWVMATLQKQKPLLPCKSPQLSIYISYFKNLDKMQGNSSETKIPALPCRSYLSAKFGSCKTPLQKQKPRKSWVGNACKTSLQNEHKHHYLVAAISLYL